MSAGDCIKWLAPSPMWKGEGRHKGEGHDGSFLKPAILRFASDSFMDELLALLRDYPEYLHEWEAQAETWREPMPLPAISSFLRVNEAEKELSIKGKKRLAATKQLPDDKKKMAEDKTENKGPLNEDAPFKLYQPAHQRYYLVASALVCRQPGLPYRQVDSGRQEQAGFVIRRLIHPSGDSAENQRHSICNSENMEDFDEYAYVMTPEGAAWRKITGDVDLMPEELVPGEERTPLFGISFTEQNGRNRRMLAGLIPVGKREAYLSALKYSPKKGDGKAPDDGEGPPDPRRILFETEVAAPWQALIEQADNLRTSLSENIPSGNSDKDRALVNADNMIMALREQVQTVSWYILLDFAGFLKRRTPEVWRAMVDPSLADSLHDEEVELLSALKKTEINPSHFSSLIEYTRHSNGYPRYFKTLLNETVYNESDIVSSLHDALIAVSGGIPYSGEKDKEMESMLELIEEPYERRASEVKSKWPDFLFPLADPVYQAPLPPNNGADSGLDNLTKLIEKALLVRSSENESMPESMTAAQPVVDNRDAWFIIRCVYERPNCGPFNPPVVSEATTPFQMASFFDPDAPMRPVRIPMPVDISPAGLRKFKKNTAFMISDMLCGKLKGIKKMTLGDLVLSVLPWPFHKDLPDPGNTGPCKDSGGSFGMICSLSIPIVTLCAFILLIIIATLFDVFFRWIPYLITCFPAPGFVGKKK